MTPADDRRPDADDDRRPEHHEREAPRREFELPRELEEKQRKAVRLEWITLAYMLSAVVLLFLTLGQSQAMKAAWIEDLLSLLLPAAFLIASRIRKRDPSEKFPWGMHRAVSVAYVFAALALLAMAATCSSTPRSSWSSPSTRRSA